MGRGRRLLNVDVHMDVDDAALLFTTLLSAFLSLKKGKPAVF